MSTISQFLVNMLLIGLGGIGTGGIQMRMASDLEILFSKEEIKRQYLLWKETNLLDQIASQPCSSKSFGI